MDKKYVWIIVTIVVVVGAAIGGYFVSHQSTAKTLTNPLASKSTTVAPVDNSVILTKTKSGIGQYLTDPKGNTLYIYNADTKGVSNCSGSCLALWPAYVDKGSTTNLPAGIGVIKRTDNGDYQYTYNGLPLYYYINDSNGQVSGNGVANFSVARPLN